LGGLQVTIGGFPAPLLYVSDTQVNATVPFELAMAASPTSMTISGLESTPFRLIVDQKIPEVFRIAGGSAAAAINQDGTVNSSANPAKVGSLVSIWATGVGWTSSNVDGQQQTRPESNCVCSIENLNYFNYSVPVYAGAAPGMADGVVQINFLVTGDSFSLAGSQRPFSIAVAP
jgi:uncharacterized protein (TIGR03437 family)